MVEKNSHQRPRAVLRRRQTAPSVPQNDLYLVPRDAGEPLNKVVDPRTAFEIFEQRLDWHSRPFEKPYATDLSRCALDRRALAPVKHGELLRKPQQGRDAASRRENA
jgi:hypothetical protein